MKHTIWVEKYRPKQIADVIFQDERQERTFLNFISNKQIPQLLLSGIQGTGKTTISKVLINELKVDRSDVLRINCSDKKIDALRSEVTGFSMTMPLGAFKIVQLEEMDFLSLEGQGLLRSLIEDTSSSCRFIATCNYDNKIIPALKSRFQHFTFKAPNKDSITLRMADILDKEKIEYDVNDLLTYVDVGYPDIRKTIQLLQSNSQNGKLLSPTSNSETASDWKFGLLDAISTGNFKHARKLVCENTSREEHEDVYSFLYQNIDKMNVTSKENAIVTIADYLSKHALVADTEICLAACMITLGQC